MEAISPFKIFESRGTLIEIHIADLHFGAMDPKIQYDILSNQFLNKIDNMNFDLLSINGDTFHHKFMSNSDVIMYASMFIYNVVKICKRKNATLIILHGTGSHDANQLKLFYPYIGQLDIRIVEHIKFEYVKGAKILCIPEEYNMGYDYYANYLFNSGYYDSVCIHGAVKGSIYGCDRENLDSNKAPVFDINSFCNCKGPIICGHVHVAGCFQEHIYYSGSPYRWQFGEEEEKGFLILLHNLDTSEYYIQLEPIVSFRYDTVNLDDMINKDSKEIIDYITLLKSNGIDYLKIKFTQSNQNINILKSYYKNSDNILIDAVDDKFQNVIAESQKNNDKFKQYEYILDPNLSPYEILTRYINSTKGDNFISVDEIIELLKN